MGKYLKVYTLTERWETFKKQDVRAVDHLIDAVELLSQDPTEENVETVRELEKEHTYEIGELEAEDREVLDDMIARILYQSQQRTKEKLTRWDFAIQRATDKGIGQYFEVLDDIITKSEEEMRKYSSSGASPEDYVALQEECLEELNKAWERTEKAIMDNSDISNFYENFFQIQVHKKRGVIERHIDYFQDNTFGEWLAGIRHDKKLSLAKAAEITGVSSSYIHRIEKGTRGVPSVPKLEQLAKGYDIPASEMITMASGTLHSVDNLVEGGAFLVNGGIATDHQKSMLADFLRSVLEGSEEEAIEQLYIVRDSLNDKSTK